MIDYHRFAERPFSDLALDLAYAIDDTFGEQFESWQKVNQASSANAKVDFIHISDTHQWFSRLDTL